MISLRDMSKNVEKFTHDNSPVVLTAVGTVGVVTTSILAAKGAVKAADILREAEENRQPNVETEPMYNSEKLAKTWKCYVPAVTSGVLTCGAIIGANQIGTRRTAAMAAAYTLSEKKLNEYRDKVLEKVGPTKEEEIRAAVNQEQIRGTYSTDLQMPGTGDQICYDPMSGRFFRSNVEAIKFAMNKVNFMINSDGHASLTDFYDALGLDQTIVSEELGWTSDELLEIAFTTVLTSDDKPAICIDYKTKPVRNYFRLH